MERGPLPDEAYGARRKVAVQEIARLEATVA